MKKNKIRTTITFDKEHYEWARGYAELRDRSISSIIRLALKDFRERNGEETEAMGRLTEKSG